MRSASTWAWIAPARGIDDADEAPRLHQADAGRPVRGGGEARQLVRVDRPGPEVTHVAPLADRAVDGVDLVLRISVRTGVHFLALALRASS
jgi:hypothetical protein